MLQMKVELFHSSDFSFPGGSVSGLPTRLSEPVELHTIVAMGISVIARPNRVLLTRCFGDTTDMREVVLLWSACLGHFLEKQDKLK